MKKIDIFNHIWPKPFHDALIDLIGSTSDITRRSEAVPMMTDLDRRFEVMDMFGPDYCQVLSLASPPLEHVTDAPQALELSRIGTDAMADLCAKYPERFPAFISTAVMTDPAGAIAEARRAIEEAGAAGIQIFTNVKGKPLDAPEFSDFFAYLGEAGKPVWMHPARGANFPDYLSETRSEYEIWWTFGWPYETSAAMARMVFSGFFDKYPGLKVITHHAGGMVPFFEGRVGPGWDQMGARTTDRDLAAVRKALKRPHLDYFKDFYADTASFGSRKAIEHAIEFFGEDHVLFASDAPFDPEAGPMYIRETIRIIEEMDISEELRRKIFQGNAVKLLGLDLKG
ncbi:amidohydrolase family protein [Oricola sp.]|uniref:amidohydrolase family protein n=1 Tax=Oricola sp. TaxID=1979950 RepID=UPI000C9146BE|nr:amidohydrolase [Ahrensia sp.]|tara:strand:+ start:14575 stop:15597 length:1023 start_codon:yes stop_codon:yes gene_type:complete